MVMYLIAGAAFVFYVTKIPERYFPGESFLLEVRCRLIFCYLRCDDWPGLSPQAS